jgi:hypothetical protein
VRRLKEDSEKSAVVAAAIITHPFRCARWSFLLIEEAPCDIWEEKKGSKGEKVQHAVRVDYEPKRRTASINRPNVPSTMTMFRIRSVT